MIITFEGDRPSLDEDVFVADNATVLGKVSLGRGSSVWYQSVLRGDVGRITVGARTNIQDLSVVHVTTDRFDTHVGDDVTVGHRAVLHGCIVGPRVLVGMGAVLCDGVEVEGDCIIGAAALVAPGTKVPKGSLVLGAPARVVRALSDAERGGLVEQAARYVALAARHRRGCSP